MPLRAPATLLLAASLAACSSSSNAAAPASDAALDSAAIADAASDVALDDGVSSDALADANTGDNPALVAARPYSLAVPKGYDASKPAPLILLLHGYSATGAIQLAYFQFDALADAKTVFVAYPDGTVDASGNHFWNATDACCDNAHTGVDDVAYLTAVVRDVQKRYAIDAKRVFVVGHSNGGFMTHRLGCERADLFAAGVSLAGAQWSNVAKCTPGRPFPIAEVHGDADAVILYGGGVNNGAAYPGAKTTVADWATLDGCTSTLTDTGTTLDLDTGLAGNETAIARDSGCAGAGAAELWTIHGGGHIPSFGTSWGEAVYAFLMAHAMP